MVGGCIADNAKITLGLGAMGRIKGCRWLVPVVVVVVVVIVVVVDVVVVVFAVDFAVVVVAVDFVDVVVVVVVFVVVVVVILPLARRYAKRLSIRFCSSSTSSVISFAIALSESLSPEEQISVMDNSDIWVV